MNAQSSARPIGGPIGGNPAVVLRGARRWLRLLVFVVVTVVALTLAWLSWAFGVPVLGVLLVLLALGAVLGVLVALSEQWVIDAAGIHPGCFGITIGSVPWQGVESVSRDPVEERQGLVRFELAPVERALADGDGDRLERVVTATMPLDKARRDAWLVWVSFWAHTGHSTAMQEELSLRYANWTALLAGLLGTEASDPAITMLVALIDGVGTRIALDPAGIPNAEEAVSAIVAIVTSGAVSTSTS